MNGCITDSFSSSKGDSGLPVAASHIDSRWCHSNRGIKVHKMRNVVSDAFRANKALTLYHLPKIGCQEADSVGFAIWVLSRYIPFQPRINSLSTTGCWVDRHGALRRRLGQLANFNVIGGRQGYKASCSTNQGRE